LSKIKTHLFNMSYPGSNLSTLSKSKSKPAITYPASWPPD
jgi:hypothetical protein